MFTDFERIKIFKFYFLIKKLNSINTLQSILYDMCFEISLFKLLYLATYFLEIYF